LIADIKFLENLVKSLEFRIERVKYGNNIYEYTAETFDDAIVIVEFEIDNELLDEFGTHIGYFGIDFIYKRIAYYAFDRAVIYSN
jgi:hypothetical protein